MRERGREERGSLVVLQQKSPLVARERAHKRQGRHPELVRCRSGRHKRREARDNGSLCLVSKHFSEEYIDALRLTKLTLEVSVDWNSGSAQLSRTPARALRKALRSLIRDSQVLDIRYVDFIIPCAYDREYREDNKSTCCLPNVDYSRRYD